MFSLLCLAVAVIAGDDVLTMNVKPGSGKEKISLNLSNSKIGTTHTVKMTVKYREVGVSKMERKLGPIEPEPDQKAKRPIRSRIAYSHKSDVSIDALSSNTIIVHLHEHVVSDSDMHGKATRRLQQSKCVQTMRSLKYLGIQIIKLSPSCSRMDAMSDLSNDVHVAFIEMDKAWKAISNHVHKQAPVIVPTQIDTSAQNSAPGGFTNQSKQQAVLNSYNYPSNDAAWNQGFLWNLNDQYGIDAVKAWSLAGSKGKSDLDLPSTLIIDTGVKTDHEDLSANMVQNAGDHLNCNSACAHEDQASFRSSCNNICLGDTGSSCPQCVSGGKDLDDHGTSVAGVTGAVGENGIGLIGVMGKTKMRSAGFIANETGLAGDVYTLFDYFYGRYKQGLIGRIGTFVNSWGPGAESFGLFFENALKDMEALWIAASGNSNAQVPEETCLAEKSGNVISVGAVNPNGNAPQFTNYMRQPNKNDPGACVGGVTLLAPGVDILSTSSQATDTYTLSSGTSVAAPHAAGVSNFIQQLNPTLSASQIKQLIVDSARTVPLLWDGLDYICEDLSCDDTPTSAQCKDKCRATYTPCWNSGRPSPGDSTLQEWWDQYASNEGQWLPSKRQCAGTPTNPNPVLDFGNTVKLFKQQYQIIGDNDCFGEFLISSCDSSSCTVTHTYQITRQSKNGGASCPYDQNQKVKYSQCSLNADSLSAGCCTEDSSWKDNSDVGCEYYNEFPAACADAPLYVSVGLPSAMDKCCVCAGGSAVYKSNDPAPGPSPPPPPKVYSQFETAAGMGMAVGESTSSRRLGGTARLPLTVDMLTDPSTRWYAIKCTLSSARLLATAEGQCLHSDANQSPGVITCPTACSAKAACDCSNADGFTLSITNTDARTMIAFANVNGTAKVSGYLKAPGSNGELFTEVDEASASTFADVVTIDTAISPYNSHPSCADRNDFVDSYGDTCAWYSKWPPACLTADRWESEGITAKTACCACGGGLQGPRKLHARKIEMKEAMKGSEFPVLQKNVKPRHLKEKREVVVEKDAKIDVTVDTSTMAAGTWVLDLQLSTDASDEIVDIPLAIKVQGEPQMEIYSRGAFVKDATVVDFGEISSGYFVSRSIIIRNSGSADLNFKVDCDVGLALHHSDGAPMHVSSGVVAAQTDDHFEVGVSSSAGALSGACRIDGAGIRRVINMKADVKQSPTMTASLQSMEFDSKTNVLRLSVKNAGDRAVQRFQVVTEQDVAAHVFSQYPDKKPDAAKPRSLSSACAESMVHGVKVNVDFRQKECSPLPADPSIERAAALKLAEHKKYHDARRLFQDIPAHTKRRLKAQPEQQCDGECVTQHYSFRAEADAQWIEISQNPDVTLDSFNGKDDAAATIAFDNGFLFPFFGQMESSCVVSLNGFVTFPRKPFQDSKMHTVRPPAAVIAPLLDDHVAGTKFQGVTAKRTKAHDSLSKQDVDVLIIQWNGVGHVDHLDWQNKFQLQLYATGRIAMVYAPGLQHTKHAKVHLSNHGGTDSVNVASSLKKFSNGATSLEFAPWFTASYGHPTTLNAGETAEITVTVDKDLAQPHVGGLRFIGFDSNDVALDEVVVPVSSFPGN